MGLVRDAWHRALPKTRESKMKAWGAARPEGRAAVGQSFAGRLHPVPPRRSPQPPPSSHFLPSQASYPRRGLRLRPAWECGARGARWQREPGPHRAPRPRPAAGSLGRPASRSPSSLCGGRGCPGTAPPRPAPAPVSARPAAVPQSRRRSRQRAGVRGRRRERSSALRACAVAASVPWPGQADQLALRLRAEAPWPPQGPAHQTLPGGRLPVWTLLLMTPGRRLPWRGMVPTRW